MSDGGKRARSPGRSRISRKTIAQGRPDDPPVPVVLPRAFCCTRTAGAVGARSSLRPLIGEGGKFTIKLAQTCGEIARLCPRMNATQSRSSWPGLARPSINLRKGSYSKKMDCRVKPGNDGLIGRAHARRDREAVAATPTVITGEGGEPIFQRRQ